MSNSTANTQGSADRVLQLLTEQRDLYRQLSHLASRQRDSITGDQPESLLAILAERQQLIDRLEAVGQQLRPVQANWRELRESLSPESVKLIDTVLGEVNKLLSGILAQDEADTALLSARKAQTGQAIGKLQTGRQAGRAYVAAAYDHQNSGADWTR